MKMKKRGQTLRDWLIVLASLADDIAVLVVVILVLRYFRVAITLPVIALIAVLLAGFVFLMHKAIVPSLHRRKVTGAEGMVGREGRVAEPLTPVGTVRVGRELWKARSGGEHIAAGEDVEVTGISDLTLEVRRKSR